MIGYRLTLKFMTSSSLIYKGEMAAAFVILTQIFIID